MPASLPPGLPIIPSGPDGPAAKKPVPSQGTSRFTMSPDDFEAAVQDALDSIPDSLAQAMDNVAVFIDDDYTPGPGEDPDAVLGGDETAAHVVRSFAGVGGRRFCRRQGEGWQARQGRRARAGGEDMAARGGRAVEIVLHLFVGTRQQEIRSAGEGAERYS